MVSHTIERGSAAAAEDAGSGSALAASPPALSCADLPGASRFHLQVSGDGKTLYYVERVLKEEDRLDFAYSLHAVDVARRTATLIAADVSRDAAVAPDGTAAFSRPSAKFNDSGRRNRVLLIKPPGADPAVVTDDTESVGDIALDRETSVFFFFKGRIGTRLWRIPVAGGKPVQVSSRTGDHILGIGAGFAVVPYSSTAERWPLDGKPVSDLADLLPNRFIGVHGDQVVLQRRAQHTLWTTSLRSPTKRSELAMSGDEIAMRETGDQAYLIMRNRDAYEIRSLADPRAPLLVVHGVRPTDVARVGDQLALLVSVDSNNDGELRDDDETDLCFVALGHDTVELKPRTTPKDLAEAVHRLAPLIASGPLAGATLQFPSASRLHITIDALPANTELRALIQQTQVKVTELSGRPHWSVALRVRETGQLALSDWEDSAGAFLLSTGMGTAQVADPTSYALEIDPAVTIKQYDLPGTPGGDGTCSGTVKNITDHPLANVEVECKDAWVEDPQRGKTKLVPATLAPGATGTFRKSVGYQNSAQYLRIALYVDGKPAPYINKFVAKRAASALATAAKVRAATQLEYVDIRTLWTGVSGGPDIPEIFVRARPAFDDLAAADRQRAAGKALAELRPLLARSQAASTARLVILRGDGEQVGWSYASGKLTDGAMRD